MVEDSVSLNFLPSKQFSHPPLFPQTPTFQNWQKKFDRISESYHYQGDYLLYREHFIFFPFICIFICLCMSICVHECVYLCTWMPKEVSGVVPILTSVNLRQGLFLNLGLRFSQLSWKPAQLDKPHISIPPVTCYMGVGI